MFKVVGVQKCSGNFEGKNWSHTKLFVLSEDKNVTGYRAEFLKVPDDVSLPAFPNIPCDISVNFNRYGNVAQVEVISE